MIAVAGLSFQPVTITRSMDDDNNGHIQSGFRPPKQTTGQVSATMEIVIDDFESYEDGGLPTRWKYLQGRELEPLEPRHMAPDEKFYVTTDGENKVLRGYTEGWTTHVTMANASDGFDWDLRSHPRLSWDWRVLRLPDGAREDDEKLNDSAAAVYVVFKFEGFLIKKPKVIKYSYSSTLPVGTVVTYGKLKIIVASSGLDGIGTWRTIERDVVADYRRVFDGDPPDRPLSIRLWVDSNSTKTVAEADFDNIRLLSE